LDRPDLPSPASRRPQVRRCEGEIGHGTALCPGAGSPVQPSAARFLGVSRSRRRHPDDMVIAPHAWARSLLSSARPLLSHDLVHHAMSDIEFFQLSRGGRCRGGNEDAVGCWHHAAGIVLAVADGLGEQSAGEVASQIAVEVLPAELAQAPTTWPLTTRLRRAVQAANVSIYQKAITVPELQGMATTLTATALVGGALVPAHVGA